MRFLLLLLSVAWSGLAWAQEQALVSDVGRLRRIWINNSDIFDAESRLPLTDLINRLHVTTRRQVIAREVWFGPGDVVDAAMAAELERNLRALDLFADVRVRLVPTAVAGEFDLTIDTRDRLTLTFGAGASVVGGVSGVRGALGERNFLGLGNRINAVFARNSEDEYRGSLSYTDLHVLDTWHTGTVRVSRTDEGDSIELGLRRPFKHLLDPRAYGFQGEHTGTEVDYYRDGESVAQVPDTRNRLAADIAWAQGPRDRRRVIGLQLQLDEHDYGAARGPLGPQIRVPGDTRNVFLGTTVRWQNIDEFRKVEGLDTLQFVQDLRLGTDFGITAGGRYRDESGASAALQPTLSAFAAWASEPLPGLLTNLTTRGGARWDRDATVGWSSSSSCRAFVMIDGQNTLASSVTFDAVEETQDLVQELTLGGDSGLRGYRARRFAGTRRLRANLEHRFDTAVEYATFRLGLVGFYDNGWIGHGADLGRPFSSVGFGLRLGSKRLIGSGVLRIDFAKPLDEPVAADDRWQISVSVGQVFTFGGNADGQP